MANPMPIPSNCARGYICAWDRQVITSDNRPDYKKRVNSSGTCESWTGTFDVVANNSDQTLFVYENDRCTGTRGTIYSYSANDDMGRWKDRVKGIKRIV